MRIKLIPQIISVFQEGYSRETFFKDLSAGIIVGIVALPMAIAFAIASGVRPEQGLYTAIIAGFLISVLSGSRVQIGGPTGAFIVIIYSVVQQYGYEGLAVATILAGIMLIIMGVAGLGAVIKFIPYPVTVGFTSGIALIIFVTQIRDFFGLKMDKVPADFVDKLVAFSHHIDSINITAVIIGIVTLLIVIYWPKVTYKIPGSLVAIIATTLVVQLFHVPVETIGSRFGAIPASLPAPHIPMMSLASIKLMFPSAFSIALLAAIESLLSAVVADGMTGQRHRSNMELVGQGVANLVSPFFIGIPATGAIARTATNIKNGGKTPVAGIIHAITLLLILLFFGKWAKLIPLATLAAILMIVAYNMSEYKLFIRLFKSPKSDVAVLVITFLLTVLVDLTVAIEVGMVLAAFLFMQRMANVSQAGFIRNEMNENYGPSEADDPLATSKRNIPSGVEVFEILGPFFFGAADKFKDSISEIEKKPKILIIRMRNVPAIDATGLRALVDIYEKTHKEGTQLLLSGVHSQPLFAMQRAGFFDRIGEENVFGNIDDALNRARDLVGVPQEKAPGQFVATVEREKIKNAEKISSAKKKNKII